MDNMNPRLVKGDTDWTRFDLVIDIPDVAARIAFGVLMSGADGVTWFNDLSLEPVGLDVPTTSTFHFCQVDWPAPLDKPINLDFSMR